MNNSDLPPCGVHRSEPTPWGAVLNQEFNGTATLT